MGKIALRLVVFFTFCISLFQANAQSGKIIRAAGLSASNLILDPVSFPPAGYTSKSTAGFAGDDVANAKLAFKPLPSFSSEPFGDLRRGPSHLYSDFVPDANGSGVYVYFDNTNLLFRMRLGSLVPGAKGYSILIDTDGKFGATGANADPTFQAATTGTNGNPGFEIEVDLFTNNASGNGIVIYNVDAPGNPVEVTSATKVNWQNYSQTSIAGTNDNGDPDYFLDFFISLSDLSSLGVTANTPLRMSATTVMAPQAAIGGPKSDIYGLNDASYKSTNSEYEAYINGQPSFTASSLNASNTSTLGPICTEAPALNSPISTGATSVSGIWTKSALSNLTTATIKIYSNGVYTGKIVTATSGIPWTVTGLTALASGAVITSKAVATGESECLSSNAVTVSSCNSATKPSTPTLSCTTTSKGLTGTNRGSTNSVLWVVHVDNLSTNDLRNSTTDASNAYFSNMTGSNWDFSAGCTNGSQMTAGNYKIYYTDNTNCNSEPIFVCVNPGKAGTSIAGTLAVPAITSPTGPEFTTATKTITGTTQTTTNGTALTLYVNNFPVATTTASTTSPYSFTFSNLNLTQGQSIYITNEYNTGTQSSSYCESQTAAYTVKCYTRVPGINTNSSGDLTAGAAITGTSSEPAGTTIKVYNSANTLLATTTVASNGTWTTAGATFSNGFSGNAVAGTSYYANATNGTCGVSSNTGLVAAPSAMTSNARCGSISGSYTSSNTSVTGTISAPFAANTIVNLYQDGTKIGTYTFTSAVSTTGPQTWTISVDQGTLYNTGILTIGIKDGGAGEFFCTSSVTVSCTGPLVPNYTQTSSNGSTGNNATVPNGGTMTYTVTNLQANTFYSVADATTGSSYATGVWTDGTTTSSSTISITTKPLTSGTYNGVVKATAIGTTDQCTSVAAASTFKVLPVTLIEFKGIKKEGANLLTWKTAEEINSLRFEVEKSTDGVNFKMIGFQNANGSNSSYAYTDNNVEEANYYRLRMVDNDGKYAYSKIILLSSNGISVVLNTVRPNPFVNEVNLTVYMTQAQPIQITLTDAAGRQVQVKTVKGSQGLNNISLDNLSKLTEGVYVLKIAGAGITRHQKLIKVTK